MRRLFTVLAVMFAVGALVVSGGAAAMAASAERQCAVVVSKASAGKQSRVVGARCGDPATLKAFVQSSTPIVHLFADINFGGENTIVYGDAGPCDLAGYQITLLGGFSTWWAHNLSSYRLYSACRYSKLWGGGGIQTGWRYADQSFIESPFNDNVVRMWVTA